LNEIVHFTSTSKDGNARDPAVLKAILKTHHLPAALATAEQIHGSRVTVVPPLGKGRRYAGSDALLTDAAGQPLGIYTADCVPVFLSASCRGVGVCHAGWRGLRHGVVRKALSIARSRWRCQPHDLYLWTGPHIGACCYEVRWETARYFPAARTKRSGRWYLDLAREVARQARQAGVPARQVRRQSLCTRHMNRFFSYRRDQTEKRQISIIMRKPCGSGSGCELT
jgi:hypothetical protein